MRKWIPPRATRACLPDGEANSPADVDDGFRHYRAQPVELSFAAIADRDLAFCSDLAARGGTAESEDGFTNERDLLRMHRAGLIDLWRQREEPFLIIRMGLSDALRKRLLDRAPQRRPAAAPVPSVSPESIGERRKGFEIARGLLGIAIKRELAACRAGGIALDSAIIEQRLMARVSAIAVPSVL